MTIRGGKGILCTARPAPHRALHPLCPSARRCARRSASACPWASALHLRASRGVCSSCARGGPICPRLRWHTQDACSADSRTVRRWRSRRARRGASDTVGSETTVASCRSGTACARSTRASRGSPDHSRTACECRSGARDPGQRARRLFRRALRLATIAMSSTFPAADIHAVPAPERRAAACARIFAANQDALRLVWTHLYPFMRPQNHKSFG